MTDITIYHNPKCGTSRNTLELIRNTGIEPHVIYYLETPPSRVELKALIHKQILLAIWEASIQAV